MQRQTDILLKYHLHKKQQHITNHSAIYYILLQACLNISLINMNKYDMNKLYGVIAPIRVYLEADRYFIKVSLA
jgi:hypothetical protein